MVKIDSNFNIRTYYGDNLKFPVFINAGDKLDPYRYVIDTESKLAFVITSDNFGFSDILYTKNFTRRDINSNGDIMIDIKGCELKHLDAGRYWYSLRLISDNDSRQTILDHRELMIFQ